MEGRAIVAVVCAQRSRRGPAEGLARAGRSWPPATPRRFGAAPAFASALAAWSCIGTACSSDDGRREAACPYDPADHDALVARAAELASWPAPIAPGMDGPAARALGDDVFVDPDPSTRGEHGALVIVPDPGDDCALSLAPIAAMPLVASPRESSIGAGEADPERQALVVVGPDPGADGDVAQWHALLSRLDVRARLLESPGHAKVAMAIDETCAAIEDGGLFVLVLAGAGSPVGPVDAAGGLVLGSLVGDDGVVTPEVMSYRHTAELALAACAHVGAFVWVIDASHVRLDLADALADGPPSVVVRASDGAAPDAARASRHGPGLLGATLGAVLEAARADACLTENRLEPAEIVRLFADLDARLYADLLAARWQAFGVAASARLEAAGELTPTAAEALRRRLARAIPAAPVLSSGVPPPVERCDVADDCVGCALGVCDAPACIGHVCRVVPAERGACDDGNDCTAGDACRAGECRGDAVVCDDGNACTDEACEPGRGCVASGVAGRACDDRDPCTGGDACGADGACRGEALVCDDGDPCTVDACAAGEDGGPGGCVFEARNLPCDDGDPCTLADQCRDQICAGTRKTCSDGNDCTADRCDATSGECRFDALADLAACDDGDACTTLDRCRDGACVGLAATCDDQLACTFDRCEDGRCVHLPAPGSCLAPDGARCVAIGESPAPCLVCAATDRLAPADEGGACDDDGVACTADVCEAGVCVHRDDARACHDASGRCVAQGERLEDCLVCEGGGVVTALPLGTPCDGGELGCAASAVCDLRGLCICP